MSEVLVERRGRLGVLTLNRPKALNALTPTMVDLMREALRAWESDPAVACVLVRGAGERGLCAGGDIRAIWEGAKAGTDFADRFWAEEYRLNAYIDRYPKPYVAFMDGIVMGGGLGVSAHGSHRVVTERTRAAMPEVMIGFSPDVGGSFLLAHAPGELGTCCGLTALNIDGADAIACGLADDFVPSSALDALAQDLAGCASEADVAGAIAAHAVAPPESALAGQRALIDRCFAHDDARAILAGLDAEADPFAARAAAALRRASPTSVAVTLRALRAARRLESLKDGLVQEYRVATACIRRPDMVEGIRAVVIDKDQAPAWSPPSLDAVTPESVAAFFAPPPGGDLTFDGE